MRILVVDDDDGLCGAIQEWLRSNVPDLEVQGDGCGRDAIQRVANGFYPDLALVDLLLPDTSGLHLAGKLRTLGVPRLIGMTGQSEPPVDEILEVFDDFLVKPFAFHALEGLFLGPADWCYRSGSPGRAVSRTGR